MEWRYKIVFEEITVPLWKYFNNQGDMGWELVYFREATEKRSNYYHIIFKKPHP